MSELPKRHEVAALHIALASRVGLFIDRVGYGLQARSPSHPA